MTFSSDDEIRFIKDSHRLLGHHVGSELLSRGWAVADLNVADEEDLEWFWPPTASLNYRGHPEWVHPSVRVRPQMGGPRSTPWTAPTRITSAGGSWRVDYGETPALKPGTPCLYLDEASLLADLERVEWWPMTVQEAHQLQAERLLNVTTAWAWNNHYLSGDVTEPHGSRFDEISAIQELPREQWPLGDLKARYLLVDAEAWASAVRTDRAGGAEESRQDS